jgi:phosphoenolpyruvate carboxykinase (ATP)
MATTLTPQAAAPTFGRESRYGLENHGIRNPGTVFWNLNPVELVEHAIRRGEGSLVDGGPFNAITRPHTGRSPQDRFIVREPSSEADIDWGKVNIPFEAENYDRLREDVMGHLEGQNLYVRDMWAGADPRYRLGVRVVTPNAWHNLFAYNMFRRPSNAELESFEPGFTILHAPEYQADPERHGTRTSTFILIHFGRKEVLIGGTRYAGEIKKSVFGLLNYLLPRQGVLSMHCSANVGPEGDSALFFGLSGTGKTTLSADPERALIGDDEHGWSDEGIFNYEGGCYAKAINLSPEGEPEIYATTRMFGTVLENCVLDEERRVDFADQSITENTRVSYPLHYIPNHVPQARGGHPRNVVFLTADAYGVLPPIAQLTPEQAMFYFLSGYTAKVAGTERGVKEPQPTFSACFGAVFIPLHPGVYAEMLGEKLREHGARVWLVNTGWTGGPYGEGSRMKLAYTRAMAPVFGLQIPTSVPGVPTEVLNPRDTWADKDAYDAQARKLAGLFAENFERFADRVPQAVRDAGPKSS